MELMGMLVVMQPNATPLERDQLLEDIAEMEGVLMVQRNQVKVEITGL